VCSSEVLVLSFIHRKVNGASAVRRAAVAARISPHPPASVNAKVKVPLAGPVQDCSTLCETSCRRYSHIGYRSKDPKLPSFGQAVLGVLPNKVCEKQRSELEGFKNPILVWEGLDYRLSPFAGFNLPSTSRTRPLIYINLPILRDYHADETYKYVSLAPRHTWSSTCVYGAN
jgi:hypothetical protein